MEEKQVIAVQVEWSATAERLLNDATGKEPTYSIGDLRSEVERSQAQLFQWFYGDENLGFTVLWIDAVGEFSEMVLQAGAAFKSNRRAAKLVIPAIEQMAVNQGCYALRTHLTDGKWASAFKSQGFYKSEVVMRKRVR